MNESSIDNQKEDALWNTGRVMGLVETGEDLSNAISSPFAFLFID